MNLNRYSLRFRRKCPVNDKVIRYTLTLETWRTVMVEEILRIVGDLPKSGFHEQFADNLAASLPGVQTLSAHHHGVDIETVRKGA